MNNVEQVRARSEGRCEAMLPVGRTWARCGKSPVEVHHRLTRGRGGRLLDELGETYHLMALCPRHHRMADGLEAFQGGLLLRGMMVKEGDHIYYDGPDPYLADHYPRPVRVPMVRDQETSHQPDSES